LTANIRLETADAIVLGARQIQAHEACTNLSKPLKKKNSPARGKWKSVILRKSGFFGLRMEVR
jgi:hypothetical protein